MNITCPSCGCKGSLELFSADEEWRRAVMAAAELPSNCGALALQYVGLFRPVHKQLSSARSCKIIREVSDIITAEVLSYDKQDIKVPAYVWIMVLERVINKPDLQRPLKNHNLLKTIAMSLATQSDRTVYTEDTEPQFRAASTGTSMKPAIDIVNKSADKTSQAEDILASMSNAKKAALYAQAKQELLDTKIEAHLIIKPMLDGMVLSIIKRDM